MTSILKTCVPASRATGPFGRLEEAINRRFGSFEAFQKEFKEQALAVFGSGYLWLVKDGGRLKLLPTKNQDTPIALGYTPLVLH